MIREQALSHFIRRLQSFILDHGTKDGNDYAATIDSFRTEFERLLSASDPNSKNKTRMFDPEAKVE